MSDRQSWVSVAMLRAPLPLPFSRKVLNGYVECEHVLDQALFGLLTNQYPVSADGEDRPDRHREPPLLVDARGFDLLHLPVHQHLDGDVAIEPGALDHDLACLGNGYTHSALAFRKPHL